MLAIDQAGLSDLAPTAWNALARTPMQRLCWLRACLETCDAGGEPQPIRAGDAIAPLVRHTRPERLMLLGDGNCFGPLDVLSDGDDVLEDMADALCATGVPFRVSSMAADAPLIAAVRRAYRRRGIVRIKQLKKGHPYIALDESWREPEAHFTSKRRANLRRQRRLAEAAGAVSFMILAPRPDEVSELLDTCFAVEAASWKGEAGTTLAADVAAASFYRRFAVHAADEGILRICFMHIGGEPAAMQIAAEVANAFWRFKIGYDAGRFERCSPGNLLFLETIRYAAERGLASYECLGRAAPWHREWTDTIRPVVSLDAYPATVSGAAALTEDRVFRVLRRLGDRGRRRRKTV